MAVMPGGVNSPVRAFKSVGGTPRFIRAARGATLEDVDGRVLLDYIGSWGVAILGHSHPSVTKAISEAALQGRSFGTPTEGEAELAEMIVRLVPSIEVVRLVNSGTEATMSAMRLARAATGRAGIIKFRGAYHGHGDMFLVEAGSGAATLGVPSSPGVPESTASHTLVANFNDLDSVASHFEAQGDQIAAVITEPVCGNMGCIPPEPGFLEGLRTICDDYGALLVFDEVMTGFRVALGGAQERYNVRPDLTTLGKVIGGGLPVGAYGGREDLMRMIAPDGQVYQAGTLSGNPLAVAAGRPTLGILESNPDIFSELEGTGRTLGLGLEALGREYGVPIRWQSSGGMGCPFFSETPVTDWQSSAATDSQAFNRFFHGMLQRDIHLPPSRFEAWFWSTAHSPTDIDRTLTSAKDILAGGLDA